MLKAVLVLTSLLIFSVSFVSVFDLHIRETDRNILWINIPIAPSEMQSLLPSNLKPSIYNGQAWFSVMLFNIESVETKIFGYWVNMPMTDGLTTKVSALVETENKEVGYAIISLDAEPGVKGNIKKMGCSGTQVGVICDVADILTLASNDVQWKTKQNAVVKGSYNISHNTPYQDKAFRDFVLNRPFKFEFDSNKNLFFNPQEGKEAVRNYEIREITNSYLTSDILNKRWNINSAVEASICKNNECFWSDWFRF